MRITAGIVGSFLVVAQSFAQTSFEEVTDTSGIHFNGRSFGVSAGDVNGDGWADIWVGNHRNLARLYQNNQDGTFTDIIPGSWQNKTTPDAHGAAFGDFDNDGDQDLVQLVGAGSGFGLGPNLFLQSEPGLLLDQANALSIDYSIARGRTPTWLDWNGDGIPDLFLANISRPDGQGISMLFQGTGGAFESQSGVADSFGGLFARLADLEGNGSRYLVLHNQFRFPGAVYKEGDNPATDYTAQLGIPEVSRVRDIAIEDFDGDLLPDMYLARLDNSASEVTLVSNEVRARILVGSNEPVFSFESDTEITVTVQPGWQIAADDIYIGSTGINPAATTFSVDRFDPLVQGIASHTPGQDKGVYLGYDPVDESWSIVTSKNGRLDINILVESTQALSNLVTANIDQPALAVKDVLLINRQTDFVAAPSAAIPGGTTACESVGAGDFDNDMDVDLYLVCRTQTSNIPNILLLNDGSGQFSRASGAAGASGSTLGRGDSVSVVDFDNDGFLDLFVTNGNGDLPFSDGPSQLFRNEGNSNNWLQVELQGVTVNRDGVGAKVTVSAGGTTQVREQAGGTHNHAQDHDRIHFGMGTNTEVATLRVDWPNGVTQSLIDVPVNQILTVVEDADPTCGAPNYDRTTDAGIFVWQDCDGSNQWHLILAAGGEAAGRNAAGFIESVGGFASIDGVNLEASDFVGSSNPDIVEYRLQVWNNGIDGFNFVPQPNACFAPQTSGSTVYLGAGQVPMTTTSLNLTTGQVCTDLTVIAELCGAPTYDSAVDRGTFIWKDCDGSDQWHLIASGGSTSLIINYQGGISATGGFQSYSPVNLEAGDIVDIATNPQQLDYRLMVWGAFVDGFDFQFQGDACFTPGSPSALPVYLGSNRSILTAASLGLTTGQACTQPPVSACGEPNYDSTTDNATFLWKDCDGSERWHLTSTGGAQAGWMSFSGVLDSPGGFASITPGSIEWNDVLDNITDPESFSYLLNIWGSGYDDFSFVPAANACFRPDLAPGQPVYIGADRTPLAGNSLNLTDLAECPAAGN